MQALNELQRGAALAPLDRPLLVLAAAGTGKTSTLAARVEYMVSQASGARQARQLQLAPGARPGERTGPSRRRARAQGVPPSAILLLAFSRKAVADLQARMAHAPCTIRTVHAFSYALLCRHWARAGYARPPTVVADKGREAAMRRDALRWAQGHTM